MKFVSNSENYGWKRAFRELGFSRSVLLSFIMNYRCVMAHAYVKFLSDFWLGFLLFIYKIVYLKNNLYPI